MIVARIGEQLDASIRSTANPGLSHDTRSVVSDLWQRIASRRTSPRRHRDRHLRKRGAAEHLTERRSAVIGNDRVRVAMLVQQADRCSRRTSRQVRPGERRDGVEHPRTLAGERVGHDRTVGEPRQVPPGRVDIGPGVELAKHLLEIRHIVRAECRCRRTARSGVPRVEHPLGEHRHEPVAGHRTAPIGGPRHPGAVNGAPVQHHDDREPLTRFHLRRRQHGEGPLDDPLDHGARLGPDSALDAPLPEDHRIPGSAGGLLGRGHRRVR